MQAVPYILMAAGTAASMAAERNAAKERRGILNRAYESNEKAQDKATEQLLGEGQKFSGEQRLQAMQEQEQAALAQALKDVGGSPQQGAGASMIDTAGGQGAVSDDFVRARADKALSEGERLTAVARELSKVRAPGQLERSESLRRAGLLEGVASAGSSSRARTNAATLDAQNVEAPWWGTAGKLAATVGAGMAAGGFGASAGGGSTYSLAGSGAKLGAQPANTFWGNAARIRF